jgi:hypothetical protein
MAHLFKVNGGIEEIEIDRSTETSGYNQLVELVGGIIQYIGAWDGRVFIVSEEGKLNKLPLNSNATLLCHVQNGFSAIHKDGTLHLFDVIVGDCILATKEEAGFDLPEDEDEEE